MPHYGSGRFWANLLHGSWACTRTPTERDLCVKRLACGESGAAAPPPTSGGHALWRDEDRGAVEADVVVAVYVSVLPRLGKCRSKPACRRPTFHERDSSAGRSPKIMIGLTAGAWSILSMSLRKRSRVLQFCDLPVVAKGVKRMDVIALATTFAMPAALSLNRALC